MANIVPLIVATTAANALRRSQNRKSNEHSDLCNNHMASYRAYEDFKYVIEVVWGVYFETLNLYPFMKHPKNNNRYTLVKSEPVIIQSTGYLFHEKFKKKASELHSDGVTLREYIEDYLLKSDEVKNLVEEHTNEIVDRYVSEMSDRYQCYIPMEKIRFSVDYRYDIT